MIESLKSDLAQAEDRTRTEQDQAISLLTQKLQLMEAKNTNLANELAQHKSDTFNGQKRTALHLENERLKKHITSRQHEIVEMRQKTLGVQRHMKGKLAELEQSLLSKYKDRMSGHLKVLDMELSKLQGVVQASLQAQAQTQQS